MDVSDLFESIFEEIVSDAQAEVEWVRADGHSDFC